MADRIDLDTQAKVSARAGVSQSTVQRILREQVDTNLDVITALARTFKVKPQWLLQPYESADEVLAPSFDEQQLLCDWRQLGIAKQHQVLGYIAVALANNSQVSYKSGTEVNVDLTRKAPATAIPVVRKASTRGVDRPELLKSDDHDKDERTKRKANSPGTTGNHRTS